MTDTPQTAPADWYPDPENPAMLRYFDGQQWTDHRSPAAPQPYAYAQPGYAYQARAAGTAVGPVSPTPLLVAGILLLVAGIARFASFGTTYEIALTAGVLEGAAMVGMLVCFIVAGFPTRRPGPRIVAFALIAVYALSTALALGIGTLVIPFSIFPLLGLLGWCVFGLGIAFGIMTALTTTITQVLRAIPVAMYGFVLLCGIVAPAAVGIAYLAAGVLYLVFGRKPNVATA